MDSQILTFVASVQLWLSNKGWGVDHVTTEEDVRWIGISSSDVA